MMILKHGRVAPGSVRVVLALAALLCSGCNGLSGPAGKEPATLSLAAWNIQALFDGTDDGTEYGEYRHSAGWSAEKYQARLGAIAQALEGAGGKGPDLVAFMELENAGVLKSLAEDVLGDQGYYWTAFGSNSELSLGLGVLSRYPISRTLTHSITINGETAPRPVLEVWISPGGTAAEARSPVAEARPLVLFVCHWKSKLGGEDNTEGLRRAAARVAARRLEEIALEDPSIPVLIIGDLNENHDEFYRRGGSFLSALLPDDPDAAALAETARAGTAFEGGLVPVQDFLVLSGEKPPVARYFTPGTLALYSPWDRELEAGSFYYKENWETIDHLLMNGAFFDGSGWEFEGCRVLDQAPFTNSTGQPSAYKPYNGNGLSDHLPLLLTLKRIN